MVELGSEIDKIVRMFGIPALTQFQKESIMHILKGENVLLISETGSGKTEAAVIPVLKLVKNKNPISVIYITPLRALNRDIFRRIVKIGKEIGLNIEIRHGDTPQHIRRQQLKDPPHFLITTPETFQILLVAPKFRMLLQNVVYIVIDEIHEFCGNKRGAQLSVGLKRLEKYADFKIIGLSATISEPEKVLNYFFNGKKVQIVINRRKKEKKVSVVIPRITKEVAAFSKEHEISLAIASKILTLIDLIDNRSTLLFTNTRPAAEMIATFLKKFGKIEIHHGSLSKEHREKVEKAFKEGALKGVIATSSLELGIDIGHVEQVIHFGSPRRVDVFTQRMGRSGHWIEKPSIGTIVCDLYEAPESGVIAKFTVEGKLEKMKLVENPLDVLAHQLVGLALENGFVGFEEAFTLVKGSGAFTGLTRKEFDTVIELLNHLKLIRVSEDGYRRRAEAWKYYYRNVSMIPEEKSFILIDINSGRKVATLDESFVQELDIGDIFVAGGESWQLVKKEGERVYATRYEKIGDIAVWVGEIIPVERFISEKIPEVIKNPEKFYLAEYAEEIKSLGDFEKNRIYVENYEDYTIFLTFAGTRINSTLAALMGSYLALQFGETAEVKSDHIGICVRGFIPRNFIQQIDEEKIEHTLKIYIHNIPSFRRCFVQVAKRFGVVERGVSEAEIGVKKLVKLWKDSPVYREAVREFLTEKFDIEGTKNFLKEVKGGKIRVIRRGRVSKLGRLLVERLYPELIESERPTARILMNVKERLLRKKFPLFCFYCKTYLGTFTVAGAPEKCPFCGARYIGIVFDLKILKKRDLSVEEKRKLEKAKETANLFLSYGKKALLVLGGRGIGPKTAAKILSTSQDELEMLEKVLEAEKLYARTRAFWE